MSDTPRTDEAFRFDGDGYPTVDADFSRQLERELNRACEMYRKLDIHTLNLVDRIKRLEEALSWRWRPIETAPYNHTWVLGYDEKDGEIGMIIFERGDESEPQWTDVVRTWSPTHWMPLPDEPKAKEAKP
jgi:hypothetical protein